MSHTSLLRLLFIGNSATYVHDIPGTLCRLAQNAGYPLESESVVKGGYTLAQHANAETDHGRTVLETVRRGFDIVFLQDNGNCVSSPEMEEASRLAGRTLFDAVRACGAKPYIYVRPPYGKTSAGRSPYEQCVAFDRHFTAMAEENGAGCVFVNRAFARAMQSCDLPLWGPDNAHTSEHGAYLAVCTFFSSLTGVSSEILEPSGLPAADARILQKIADDVALHRLSL